MNPEQMKEIAIHLTEKLNQGEIVSSYIGVLFGLCNNNVDEVKELIDFFAEESKKTQAKVK